MGKGDKKSRRGKLFQGSYGVLRPHHIKKLIPKVVEKAIEVEAPPAKPKRAKKETKKKES
jgi:30S ribosomal protein S31